MPHSSPLCRARATCLFRPLAGLAAALQLVSVAAPVAAAPKQTARSDTSRAITVESGACARACPAFSARIAADGAVAYNGSSNVAVIGRRSAKRPAESFAAVRDLLTEYRPAAGSEATTTGCGAAPTGGGTWTVTWEAADGTRTVLRHPAACASERGQTVTAVLDSVPEWLGITEWVERR